MAIDRGDWHMHDAKTWPRACRHIALFLAWAAQRGLASPEIRAREIAKGPTAYFIKQCDTKLSTEDLTAEGNRFVRAAYTPYLKAVHAYAAHHELDDYEIPESKPTERHFFAWLDARLAAWRQGRAKKGAAAKETPARPKKKASSATKTAARPAKRATRTKAKPSEKPGTKAKAAKRR